MYTLEQLRAFETVADERHFGRAAETLRMTAPALTRQIQRLEADLGLKLLDRGGRRVVLTAAGEVFLRQSRMMLNLAENSRRDMHSRAQGRKGLVTIAFTATAAFHVLGPLLQRMTEFDGDVDVRLLQGVSDRQLEWLESGVADIGLLRVQRNDDAIASMEVDREPLVLALTADHPLAASGSPCSVTEIARYPMIGYHEAESAYFHSKIRVLFGDRPLQITYRVSQVFSMLLLVSQGRGTALVPRSSKVVSLPNVVYRPITPVVSGSSQHTISLYAAWAKGSNNPLLASTVRQVQQLALELRVR
jgi:DNA-binding transcriptional LysR family regulator